MTSPLLALRAAILARLAGDAALAALMGGTVRLHDEPPRGSAPVHAVFGQSEARDDSVDGARRHALGLGITVYGKPGSARTAIETGERIAALLDDGALVLAGHALVFLRVAAITARRDEASGETRAVLALEAVTEVTAP